MSGLVTGLQNRAQRFESASDLNKESLTENIGLRFFYCIMLWGCKMKHDL